MERKNKVAGQQATAIQNTRNYEESILHELLAQELTTVTLPDTFDQTIALLRPKAQGNSKEVAANGPSNMANYQRTLQWSFYALYCHNPA